MEYSRIEPYFVKTRAFSNVLKKLHTCGYVVVKGNPGDGKTTIAVYVIKTLMEKGKIPIQIRTPSDWDEFVSPGENLVIFIDNMFGEFSLSQSDTTQWSNRFLEMKASVDTAVEGSGNLIIITIRNDIYEECCQSLKDDLFFRNATVDISDKENKLSTMEMTQFLEIYVPDSTDESFAIDSDTFFADVPNLGFPQCCRLFKDNAVLQEDGFPSFFKNPLYFLKEGFRKYIRNKEMKMAVLVFVLMKGGKVNRHEMEKSLPKSKDLKSKAMKMCEVQESFIDFHKAIYLFLDSFLVLDNADECYRFSHSSVQNSLFLVLGDICEIEDLIGNCDHTLLKYLTTKSCPKSKMDTLLIIEEQFECVAEKIICLIETRIPSVFASLAELVLWQDNVFYREFLVLNSRKEGKFLYQVDEESNSMMVHFAATGNVKWVQYIFENVKEKLSIEQHYLSLNAACECNHLKTVEYLLKVQVKPDIKSCFHAVRSGRIEPIKLLAAQGVDLRDRTYSLSPYWRNKPDTISVLDEACLRGQNHLVLDLLNICPELLYTKNESGEFSLLFVAYAGATKTLEILIEKGLDPYERSSIESTILHCACQNGKLDTFQFIVNTYPDLLQKKYNNSTQGTLLHRTAEGGNTEMLKMLVDKGKNIFCRTSDGKTVLHKACKDGRFDMSKYLIDTYPELLLLYDSEGRSPIHDAGLGGNVEIFELLKSKGLNVKSVADDGKTSLHYACSNGRLKLCKHLVQEHPVLLRVRDKKGLLPLHEAAWSGSIELFKFLMEAGNDIDIRDKTFEGCTVLHQSADGGRLEMSKYLLDKDPSLLHEIDDEGMTVLHRAALGGNTQLFKMLEEMGLQVTEKTKNGQSVLHLSCKQGKLLMSSYLIAKYRDLLYDLDKEGNNVSHTAAYSGNTQLLVLLQQNKVDIHAKSEKGETPLHTASTQSKIDMCRYLLSTDENDDLLNTKDKNGASVLHSAAIGGYVDLFILYVDRGLRAIDTTSEGKSVLSYAARHCRIDMCKYIIEKYGDLLWHTDNLGESLLHDAARGGNIEVLEIFISEGLNLFAKNKLGETVLHIGCLNKKFKFCDYIVEKYPALLNEEDNQHRKVVGEISEDSLQTQYRCTFIKFDTTSSTALSEVEDSMQLLASDNSSKEPPQKIRKLE
jgi:ankyrin repeat protein